MTMTTRENLSHEQIELLLYCEHDSFFAPAYFDRAYKTLGKFHKEGTFSLDRAIAYLDRYLVFPGGKDYVLNHCSMTDSVKTMFPKAVRTPIAEVLAHEMVAEFRLGNY
jgi:hypothetical protein